MDRFHFKKHKDNFCSINNNPDTIALLNKVNTSVCEQTNYWFGRFKHICKHMNYERYHLFIYIMCDEYNKNKLTKQKYEANKKF